MDPQIDPSYFTNFFPAIISLIITGLASVVIGIYFEKFRNKIIFLKYKVFFQPLATTSKTDYWGEISVYYEKRIINHLNFVTITLKNDSNNDLENIDVDTWVDNQSQFLAVRGNYDQTGNSILLESGYFNYYKDVLDRNLQDVEAEKDNPDHVTPPQLMNEIQAVMGNKKFHLPVFNRKTSITLNLLIENFQGRKPEVSVSVLHKSVKLILETDKEIERKQTTKWTVIIGMIIYAIGLLVIYKYFPISKQAYWTFAALGLTYSSIGFLIYKSGRFIKRFFW
jgi:hypothetical protein